MTVRTLHHYDHLGLVCPSERTTAGHRLYDTGDVQRLYQVLALRQLGLPLESISAVLEGKLPLGELLERHRGHLDRQLAVIRNLRAQLDTMITQVNAPGGATVTDFTELIQKVVTVDETIRSYFSETQLAELAQRRERAGEEAVAEVEARWPRLLARVQEAIDAGTDPSAPEAREMAREWQELLHRFHGGDDNLRDSLYRMQSDNAEEIRQQYGGPTRAQMDFIARAGEAGTGE